MKKLEYILLLFLSLSGCIQKFQPNLSSPATGYLVVEGNINTNGPAMITLSRTTSLNNSSIVYENGAIVQVEGNDNSVYLFSQNDSGNYGINQLILSNSRQYRLRIKTKGGEEYLSDFEVPETSPAIDSINWQLANGGVQIYANTHDPQNKIPYYQWDFVETWEFHSPFISELNYDTAYTSTGVLQLGVLFRNGGPNLSIETCWQSAPSTEILLASSAALNDDIIVNFPVTFVPQNSIKLTAEYSILVNQYALSENAYNYLQIMKANTEETGSLFNPQPSQLQGNIHSLSNPAETVVGYISFSSVQSKRIFIYNTQLPLSWSQYNSGCILDSVYVLDPGAPHDPQDQIEGASSSGLVPTTPLDFLANGAINRFLAGPPVCIDCTLSGTNQKPSFWQ